MTITATRKDAYKLLLEGVQTLSQVEANGIRVDLAQLDKTAEEVDRQIKRLNEELRSDPTYLTWRKRFGENTKLGSREQLGEVLFEVLKHPCKHWTATGRPATTDAVLRSVPGTFTKNFLEVEKLKKFRSTYLGGIREETVAGFLHPVFNLHVVQTYRSCIAKGTLIETVRDVSKHPKGIPIEKVKVGDYVYCYNDDDELVIRKVLWAGKTGTREVIRLHWHAIRGKSGYIDLTPEHRVRTVSGKYVKAKDLLSFDLRGKHQNKHSFKARVMALGRRGHLLYPTGDVEGILDHRLVYEELVGSLKRSDIVHHKDGNHLNNKPTNLQKMSPSEHAKHHAQEVLTDEVRRKGVRARVRNHRLYGDRWPTGEKNYRYIKMSKFSLLRMLSEAGGRCSRARMDFTVLKRKASKLGVNLSLVKDRYDRDGNYITRGELLRLMSTKGRTAIQHKFGINYYKAKRMLEQRGLMQGRRYGNQFGIYLPNNHRITKIEWIKKVVDVYDLEVEEHHNFIANEVCVHNSSDSPNFQNLPVRDPVLGKWLRDCFIPRKGCHLVETDYGSLEFNIAACFWKDPGMVEYASDPSKDIHRDIASQCYLCPKDQVSKRMRYNGKNCFVFPILYGSYWRSCAKNLWPRGGEKLQDGETDLLDWLKKKGIYKLGNAGQGELPREGTYEHHIYKVEKRFNAQFPLFGEGKEKWWALYQKRGWFDLMTGFRVSGLYSRNDLMNYPIQGPGFHALLWSLTYLQKWIRKKRMRTLLVGQIHDCILADVPEDELQEYLSMVKEVMTVKVVKAMPWIIVPLKMEPEVTPRDGTWHQKALWVYKHGHWAGKN